MRRTFVLLVWSALIPSSDFEIQASCQGSRSTGRPN